MNKKKVENISMNGRMAYGILCVESYLKSRFPDDNWTALSELMWEATSSYWDKWDNKFIEVIPEYLFEKASYAESAFDCLTEAEYNSYVELLKGKPSTVNDLLMKLHELQEVYCYTNIPGKGDEATQIVLDICEILMREGIEIPSVSLVAFSTFSEKNGWGEQFDGRKLSFILGSNQ